MGQAVNNIEMYEVLKPRLGADGARIFVGFINSELARQRGQPLRDGITVGEAIEALDAPLGNESALAVVGAIQHSIERRFAKMQTASR